MSSLGIKGVMARGRGDRSCIRTSAKINNTKKAGIDIAVTSTSPLRRKAHGIMPPLHLWIKISNAGSKRPTPTCTGAGRRTSPRCFATSHGGKKRLGETLLRHRHADDTPAGERPRGARARPQRRTWGQIPRHKISSSTPKASPGATTAEVQRYLHLKGELDRLSCADDVSRVNAMKKLRMSGRIKMPCAPFWSYGFGAGSGMQRVSEDGRFLFGV